MLVGGRNLFCLRCMRCAESAHLMLRLLNLFTNLFPVWVLLGGIAALFKPALFIWFKGPAIIWGLAVIMLGMGVTLTLDDFKRVLEMPRSIAAGFIAQFSIMPFL